MRLGAIVALLLAASINGEISDAVWPEQEPLIASGEDASSLSDRVLQSSCVTNITEVYLTEGNIESSSVPRTYTLCPNTVFNMGFLFNDGSIVEGQQPIVPRANAHYKCGDSGSSNNNCTITTGSIGLFFFDTGYNEPLVNSSIQGLTFASLQAYGVVFSDTKFEVQVDFIDCIFQDFNDTSFGVVIQRTGGTITFVDCVFRRFSSIGPIQLDWSPPPQRLLPALTNPSSPSNRNLATANFTNVLEAVFDGCIFRDNVFSLRTDGAVTNPGVITSITESGKHTYVNVSNSLFANNTYTNEIGFAIQVDDSVSLKSNCFIDNDFVGNGPVQVILNATLTSSDNFGVSNGNVTCPYAYLIPDLFFNTTKCVPYESDSCSFLNVSIPPSTSPPSTAPAAPSTAPAAPSTAPVAPSTAPAAPSTAPAAPSTAPAAPSTAPAAPPAAPVPSPGSPAPVAPTTAPVSNATSPAAKTSDAVTYREASNAVAVGGIILCWLLV